MVLKSIFGTAGALGWNVSLVIRKTGGVGRVAGGLASVSRVIGGAVGGAAGAGAGMPKAFVQAATALSHAALISSGDLTPKAFAMRVQSPKVMPARISLMASAILTRSSGRGSSISAAKCLPMACRSSVSRVVHSRASSGPTC